LFEKLKHKLNFSQLLLNKCSFDVDSVSEPKLINALIVCLIGNYCNKKNNDILSFISSRSVYIKPKQLSLNSSTPLDAIAALSFLNAGMSDIGIMYANHVSATSQLDAQASLCYTKCYEITKDAKWLNNSQNCINYIIDNCKMSYWDIHAITEYRQFRHVEYDNKSLPKGQELEFSALLRISDNIDNLVNDRLDMQEKFGDDAGIFFNGGKIDLELTYRSSLSIYKCIQWFAGRSCENG